nr:SIR2 family protein [uncultured Desulfuromonas sp.]
MSFPDQVHVERIAEALWRKSPLGTAALMVGAGLSRNAHSVTAPGRGMPTWEDLGKNLCDSLYPPGDTSCSRQRSHALKKAAATSGALRLAQEYEASFGRTQLNRLLKTYVPDEEFSPSELHVNFLKLPWADVFTTNWDTLLERATDMVVDRRYDVVRTHDDIPASQQPRIIKLHGSFPSNYPFIFTEEDYRRYPSDFTCFVNMVQQSMMENIFCLIGFSGDDPNFLHWAGWVRDNLGEAAPKIYLVGWLDLATVQRRVLEDRNVIPVDLSRIPQSESWPEECRYRYALEWFQWRLKLKQPHSGALTPPEYLKIDRRAFCGEKKEMLMHSQISGEGQEVEKLAEICSQRVLWEEEREQYEGWVVAPQRVRNKITAYTTSWISPVVALIPHMSPWEKLFILREIVWRLDVSLRPLVDDLAETIIQVLEEIDPVKRECFKDGSPFPWIDPNWAEARRAWGEVASSLLRYYRFEGMVDDFQHLAQRLEKLSDCNGARDVLAYQKSLLALQEMDYAGARKILADWRIDGSDHIWAVRKAGFLFELSAFNDAYELLAATLPAIRRSIRRDLDDVAALSREACAMQLIEIAEWNSRFQQKDDEGQQDRNQTRNPDWRARWTTLLAKGCDIRDEWQSIVAQLGAPIPQPWNIEVTSKRGFDLGRISTNRRFKSDHEFLITYHVLYFAEAAGMPPFIRSGSIGTKVSEKELGRAALWLKIVNSELAIRILLRACSSGNDETLNDVATREIVALLKYDFVEKFLTILLRGASVLAESIETDRNELEKLRVAMELLSRLSQRITVVEQKQQVFDLAISLVQNNAVFTHPWLSEELSRLLKRAIECFEPSKQHNLILPLLNLPTSGIDERFFGGEPWWWENFSEIPENKILAHRNYQSNAWNEVISDLFADAEKKESRKRAVSRLTFLHHHNLLDESEKLSFAKVLWAGNIPLESGLPAQTGLLPWVFLGLPEFEAGAAERAIREKYLSSKEAGKGAVGSYLENLGRILGPIRERRLSFSLSVEETELIATKIAEWSMQKVQPKQRLFDDYNLESEMPSLTGVAKLLPFVSIENDLFSQIMSRIEKLEEVGVPCYSLYPPMISQFPETAEGLIAGLKEGMAKDDCDLARSAVRALEYWIFLVDTGPIDFPPEHLFEEVGMIIYLRRTSALAPALSFCSQLFEKWPTVAIRTLSERLKYGLSCLFETCRYQKDIISNSSERLDIPLMRYLCVKLSLSMEKAGCSHSSIAKWIEAAPDDPLVEVRNLVVSEEE